MASARVLLAVPVPHGRGVSHRSSPPHIGLASIAACLEAAGVPVSVFDGTVTRSDAAFERAVRDFAPTHVGFSAYTRYVKSAARAADIVRRIDRSIVTVLGGPHATALPDGSLSEFPGFDLAVVGEGERVMESLAHAGSDRSAWQAIPGLYWRDGEGIAGNPAGLPVDLEALPPPAWRLFDLPRYTLDPVLNRHVLDGSTEFRVEVSRGCPCACTFCSHVLGRQVRGRSVDAVLDEIGRLRREHGARSVIFNADTFTLDRAYTVDLCEGMLARGWGRSLSWICETRVDRIDPELCRLMRRAGCRAVVFGLESGSPEVLASIRKGYPAEAVRPGVEAARKAGLLTFANFILGLPAETVPTALATIRFARSLPLDFATFTLFVPFPGSPATRQVEQTPGFGIVSRDWDRYDTQSAGFLIRHPHLPAAAAAALHRLSYAVFYLRPGYLHKPFRIVDPSSLAGLLR